MGFDDTEVLVGSLRRLLLRLALERRRKRKSKVGSISGLVEGMEGFEAYVGGLYYRGRLNAFGR